MWEQASCPLQYNTMHGSPQRPVFDLANLTCPGHRDGAYDPFFLPSGLGDAVVGTQWQAHGQSARNSYLHHDATRGPRVLKGPRLDLSAGTRDPHGQGGHLFQAPPENALLQTAGASLPCSSMQPRAHGRASSYRSAAAFFPGDPGAGAATSVALPTYSAVVPVQDTTRNDNAHHIWPAAEGHSQMPKPPHASARMPPPRPAPCSTAAAARMPSESELEKLLQTSEAISVPTERERPAFATAHAVNMACHAVCSPAPRRHPISRPMAATAAAANGSSSGGRNQHCRAHPVQMEPGHDGRPPFGPDTQMTGNLKPHEVHSDGCGGQQGEEHMDQSVAKPRQHDLGPFVPLNQQYRNGTSRDDHHNKVEQALDVDCSPVIVPVLAEVTPEVKAETMHEQVHESVTCERGSRRKFAPIPVHVRQASCEPVSPVSPWIKGEKRVRDELNLCRS